MHLDRKETKTMMVAPLGEHHLGAQISFEQASRQAKQGREGPTLDDSEHGTWSIVERYIVVKARKPRWRIHRHMDGYLIASRSSL